MRKLAFVAIILSNLFLLNSEAICETKLEGLLSNSQIAVEKQTGRGEEYNLGFSGSVGSLRYDIIEKTIYISEFLEIDGKVNVLNGIYKIINSDKFDDSIDFECVDFNSITKGIEWKGKIWLADDGSIKVELTQKKSPRKWVNLGEYGRRFLRENNLVNLELGI